MISDSTPAPSLARLAVELLAGRPPNFEGGASMAIERNLGGLYLHGIESMGLPASNLAPSVTEALRRQTRQESGHFASASIQIALVLDSLRAAGVIPVVLKGQPLARAVWPRIEFRPQGDMDFLVEERDLPRAVAALEKIGYRPGAAQPAGSLRPKPHSLELGHGDGRMAAVDLHTRLFRSVGTRIDTSGFIDRAETSSLLERPIRELEASDLMLFVFVHAAKHGVRRLKWLLDIYGLALAATPAIWRRSADLAMRYRSSRPFHAACCLVAALPGIRLDPRILAATLPSPFARWWISNTFQVAKSVNEEPISSVEAYLFELLLEESMRSRLRRMSGVLQRTVAGIGRAFVGSPGMR